ncbi:unnamed protein product [Phaeothamnion confervicola]
MRAMPGETLPALPPGAPASGEAGRHIIGKDGNLYLAQVGSPGDGVGNAGEAAGRAAAVGAGPPPPLGQLVMAPYDVGRSLASGATSADLEMLAFPRDPQGNHYHQHGAPRPQTAGR